MTLQLLPKLIFNVKLFLQDNSSLIISNCLRNAILSYCFMKLSCSSIAKPSQTTQLDSSSIWQAWEIYLFYCFPIMMSSSRLDFIKEKFPFTQHYLWCYVMTRKYLWLIILWKSKYTLNYLKKTSEQKRIHDLVSAYLTWRCRLIMGFSSSNWRIESSLEYPAFYLPAHFSTSTFFMMWSETPQLVKIDLMDETWMTTMMWRIQAFLQLSNKYKSQERGVINSFCLWSTTFISF